MTLIGLLITIAIMLAAIKVTQNTTGISLRNILLGLALAGISIVLLVVLAVSVIVGIVC